MIVNNHVYKLHAKNETWQEYWTKWWMQDGDGVTFDIKLDSDGSPEELHIDCFSGFPASKVIIHRMDFDLFPISDASEDMQAIHIADYIITKLGLCEYHD